jgi:2,4-dienoyl-CoA reductase-like NADH-dependent reductase (Old Yellow Enzyme family)
VLENIRSNVGDDFPVLIKLNSADFTDGGLTLEDSVRVGRLLQGAGTDAIEVSGGTVVTGDHCQEGIDSDEKEAYWGEAAEVFKEKLRVPLIPVGGVRSFQLAEKIVDQGLADYISMSRPFIAWCLVSFNSRNHQDDSELLFLE